ncbi:hypothetical protein [Synechococcus elongatus]|uniref:Uncharacterized protein n=2 Tax=Synechococcus elongatus TaxID=32046 RepID=Q31LP3_SYNE7|nr:hypothetical protein [Synechococcus elongatus]ABB58026.1 conserved hypothetical protein [Synechococcus elongatus PCC 7942 = FACHB-805]AJD57496.1 hypothetical protein M744_06435 [Synechococcus elongatus UTEX 2973]MBD2586743.1 hypothetical protein [Synechococcus elongatus FACHB-242]MBD2687815.1 hypothetical protein [Synechococcus elongatus FACHB-1061]MBD2706474.1 hypothetical protein [Synechococcus elongatus PCC 7942 = FACHB-805]
MDWDIQIIKHYSSTSHSRLLNQLKRELRDNPLPRRAPTAAANPANAMEPPLRMPAKGGNNRRFRYVPLGQTDSRSSGGQAQSSRPSTNTGTDPRYTTPSPAPQTSFRDRLQAVEVR